MAVNNKHPGNLTHGIILLHDNAHPHIANSVKTKVQYMRWEALEHLVYSLYCCDFHIFDPLKQALKGC
jgi:hypothetical protein